MKFHLDRLRKKYGYKNEKLGDIVKKILTINQENVSRGLARKAADHWRSALPLIKTDKAVVVPTPDEAMPPRAVFAAKSAQSGRLITDTLRDRLTKDLRSVVDKLRKEKKDIYFKRGEGKRGRLKPEVVQEFQNKIKETFSGYVKKDPKTGIPPNIRNIAVTEIRSATNMMKDIYAAKIEQANPEIEMLKTWVQNVGMSKVPRKGHSIINGMTVRMHEYFSVPLYEEKNGAMVYAGSTRMSRPHDPKAPPGQVIGCNCELVITATKRIPHGHGR